MSPDHRAKFPPESRPLPPVRTLRGEAEPVATASAAWAAPVRSGLVGPPLPSPRAGKAAGTVPAFAAWTGPVTPPEPALPLADWTEDPDAVPVGDLLLGTVEDTVRDEPAAQAGRAGVLSGEPEAPALAEEIFLHDEVFWLDDAAAIVEGQPAETEVESVEALTIGDVGTPVAEAGHEDLPTTEWEALGQPFEETLVPGPEIPEGAAPGESATEQAATGPEDDAGPDPRELASRLERLADQIRMHGTDALDAAQEEGDSIEAELARTLAGRLRKKE